MLKAIIKDSNGLVVNVIILPDNWTGAPQVGIPGDTDYVAAEWQPPAEHLIVDAGNGGPGDTWDGTKFFDPNQITEEEQTENYLAAIRVERNNLLHTSDWTQGNDSPLTDEVKASWATYRQELRDIPETYTADPDAVVWPEAPE